ncbi:MAG: tRNA threonylcarbamoyladenosine biosynthesis protein TsaB, partial [Chitinophagaceae bacterium]
LITINTLRALAATVREQDHSTSWLCPMIDARRQEVFTVIYNRELVEQLPPKALILNTESFAEFLLKQPILFFGSGMPKWKKCCSSPNARFLEENVSTRSLSVLSFQSYLAQEFSDLAYAEPFYLKEFHFTG